MSFTWRKLGACASFAMACGCSLFPIFDDCSTDIQKQVVSPDGEHVVAVFHRECGATTGFNTQVSIRSRSQSFDPKAGQVLAVAGRHRLGVDWIDAQKLVITLPRTRVYNEQSIWEKVQIKYLVEGGEAK